MAAQWFLCDRCHGSRGRQVEVQAPCPAMGCVGGSVPEGNQWANNNHNPWRPGYKICNQCHGRGTVAKSEFQPCSHCRGVGQVLRDDESPNTTIPQSYAEARPRGRPAESVGVLLGFLTLAGAAIAGWYVYRSGYGWLGVAAGCAAGFVGGGVIYAARHLILAGGVLAMVAATAGYFFAPGQFNAAIGIAKQALVFDQQHVAAGTPGSLSAHVEVASLAGIWRGSVTQPRYGSYPAVMTLVVPVGGSLSGLIEYPTLGCRGALSFIDRTSDTVHFKETMSSGNCVSGGAVQLNTSASDSMTWRWLYPSGTLGATGQFARAR